MVPTSKNIKLLAGHVDLLWSFALFTWVIIRIAYFQLCPIKQKTKCILKLLPGMSFYSENSFYYYCMSPE